jgi:hypothetical protein
MGTLDQFGHGFELVAVGLTELAPEVRGLHARQWRHELHIVLFTAVIGIAMFSRTTGHLDRVHTPESEDKP